ncbi:MAG: hypothetical protein K6E71_04330 [Lachnospiraceae bacterium]|nr:hypothetical protein [Lachnospiraceae bacterium]
MLRKVLSAAKFILLLSFLLLLCGCGEKAEAVNPLSDEEVISYVCSEIQKEYGDEITAEITSKTDLQVCTDWLDGPIAYTDAKGGHVWELSVRRKDGTGVAATARYSDGYKLYGKTTLEYKPEFSHTYESTGIFRVIQDDLEKALSPGFAEHYIYRSLPDTKTCRYTVFLVSNDAEAVADVISRFQEILSSRDERYQTSFNLYIYKDKGAFRDIDFSKLESKPIVEDGSETLGQCTTGSVVESTSREGFHAEFFDSDGAKESPLPERYVDPAEYDCVVFWYHWERNQSLRKGIFRVYCINR